jgi:aryl-alcohol dehydrogenase-like predicted oxidoreductase
MFADLEPGSSSVDSTRRYAERFLHLGRLFRPIMGRSVSVLGIGTNFDPDESKFSPQRFRNAVDAAITSGVNLIDTASSYGNGDAERLIGDVLRMAISSERISRQELFLCSKASIESLISHKSCEERILASCARLGCSVLDLFYIHNPESLLRSSSQEGFYGKLASTLASLEAAVMLGHLRWYGISSWSGFRCDRTHKGHLSLQRVLATVRSVCGTDHHFRFIQLPFNAVMTEAQTLMNQPCHDQILSTMQAAIREKLYVIGSSTLAGGRLGSLRVDALAARSGVSEALRFSLGAPELAAFLVGMTVPEHIAENLDILSSLREDELHHAACE